MIDEHVFVTSQGTAHGRFQRALDRDNVPQAEHAARELGWLSLGDALALVVAYARTGSPKFEPAAVRWLAAMHDDRPAYGAMPAPQRGRKSAVREKGACAVRMIFARPD